MDPRQSMLVLPKWSQNLLTWITGKPYQGQKALFQSTWLTQTFSALFCLYGSALLGAFICHQSVAFWTFLLPCWLYLAGAARKIQVTLVHQCAHFNYSGNAKFDRVAAQILSTLVFVDHFDSYYREHILIHHTKQLSSAMDPDCKFLLELGIKPGMTVKALWRQLFKIMFSPSFHYKFFRARFRANFITPPLYRRIMALSYHSIILGFALVTGSIAALFFAWIFPLTFVYHIAAFLNFTSLHFWLKQKDSRKNAKEIMCELTAGRFLGEVVPQDGSIIAWVRWFLRMSFVHLPLRIAVLSGDLPVHDYHHRYPRCSNWANFIYMRNQDIENNYGSWAIPYTENWGLFNAIEAVFENLGSVRK